MPFVFAIRAQDRASMFEREGDYMRCLAVEDQEEMKDWVLSIRSTKVTHTHTHFFFYCQNLIIYFIFRVTSNINITPTEC